MSQVRGSLPNFTGAGLPVLEFSLPKPVTISGTKASEAVAEFLDTTKTTRRLHKVSGLVSHSELTQIDTYIRGDILYDDIQDSVDKLPAYESVLMQEKQWTPASPPVFRHLVEDKIEPLTRKQYSCPGCVVCTSLVRRFLPQERLTHKRHYDRQAFATVILAINPEEYVGGYFVQPLENATSRRFLELVKGDLIFHRYDVDHGVNVKTGIRYSVIFWVFDTAKSCSDSTTSWYRNEAPGGDAVAQFGLADMLNTPGSKDYDLKEALAWYQKSAEQGFPHAQLKLGSLITDEHAKVSWFIKAAEQGMANAEATLGLLYLKGHGVPKQVEEGLAWLYKAAEHEPEEQMTRQLIAQFHSLGELSRNASTGDIRAIAKLGRILVDGVIVPQDTATGLKWIAMAAERGEFSSQWSLAKMHYEGSHGLPRNRHAALNWMRKAAAAGSPAEIRDTAQRILPDLEAEVARKMAQGHMRLEETLY
eukprot:gnl/MRDRNA2_/MRDRNA2_67314_c0_seq1.p1 gnl/MRDRNA2_/MRDRNA2_67314_c0~~gnl/MRDRNA2_/MRDRNA2_67314_c0_seq1.p1  ORF type:complete len:476 (+),score=77.44 gnl/MRDRNA2_/MRDRNA2_67314_c0_seq1:1-1428(+)